MKKKIVRVKNESEGFRKKKSHLFFYWFFMFISQSNTKMGF